MWKSIKLMLATCCAALVVGIFGAFAQNGGENSVQGIVKDAAGPIVGATVITQDGSSGTTTTMDGSFTLSRVKPGDVIVISFIGYQTQEIPYVGQTMLDVTLQEEATALNTVVVTAMGIKREEKALSYNVQQVKSDEITTVKDANFMNSMVGKVAGVTINSSAVGAGGSARVVMRGTKSLTKSNNALYVIDGIPMFNTSTGASDISVLSDQPGSDAVADLNPEDIESINMLTGPSAAALYGSDAASGVVLINTKRGTKDKTTVTYSNNTTFSLPYMMPKFQNSYVNAAGALESWGARQHSSYNPEDFFNTGTNVINSVVFTTGTSRNQTYVSASTTNTSGLLPNTKYERYNFTFRNTSSFLKDKLTLDLGGSYIIQNDRNLTAQGQYYNPLTSLYLFPRGDNFDEVRNFERYKAAREVYEQYWPYTTAGIGLQNPYWVAYRMVRENNKKRYMYNATLKYQITDWMDISGRAKVDNTTNRYTFKKYATTDAIWASENGGYQDEQSTYQSFYGDVMLNINKTWNDWSLSANIGGSINDQRYQMIGHAGNLRDANLFAVHNLDYTTKYKPKQAGWHDQVQSVFANVEVGWRSMLYLTVTGRNDWDSRLAGSKESSFFYPSVGLSAVVSNMFDAPRWLSFLKVRGSYAEVGSAFDRFLTRSSYPFNEESKNWETLARYPVYELKPEKTKSWEVGVNAKFLNKISFDFTYYRSHTTNQTFNVPLSASSGYDYVPIQSGDIQNQGIEMGIGYNNKWGDFTFSTNYNFTWNQNKVIRLGGGVVNPATGEVVEMETWEQGNFGNLDARVILKEGGSMGDVYAAHVLATDSNGNIKVDPQTGAISMMAKDVKLGSILPDFNMGWSNNFDYKGINLGVTFSARIGGIALSSTESFLDQYGVSERSGRARDNGGVPVNYGKVDAKTYYQGIAGYGAYYAYSATNVRLQELSLGYTLPAKWFRDKVRMTVSFVGRNLWMIYCKAPFDPEVTASTTNNYYQSYDYFMLPSTRNLGFSVKLQF